MEFLSEYGLFLAKTITFVVALGIVIAMIMSAGAKNSGQSEGHVEVKKLNDKYQQTCDAMKSAVLSEALLKEEEKRRKKEEKERKKKEKEALKLAKKAEKNSAKATKDEAPQHQEAEAVTPEGEQQSAETAKALVENPEEADERKRCFVVDFRGDIKASATEEMREAFNAILSIACPSDEVVVRLESPGGMVHSYGLASSQLARITKANIPLTICVDKVAASGGYMMACVADKILAAPFAIIGSIGVMAQIPNFHKVLKKHDVEYELLTAGEYKRTLTMFGENTEKGRKKFVEDLEDTHVLFKDFIAEHRSVVNVEEVATGEIWFGSRAIDKQLIDGISTSDEYLFEQRETADIYHVSWAQKKTVAKKLGLAVESSISAAFYSIMEKVNQRIF